MCNKVEDELHFLIKCPKYKQNRKPILEIINKFENVKQLNEQNQLIWLLSNEDKHICKALGKFVKDSFDLRQTFINQNSTNPKQANY